jgi:hypothetical protein
MAATPKMNNIANKAALQQIGPMEYMAANTE